MPKKNVLFPVDFRFSNPRSTNLAENFCFFNGISLFSSHQLIYSLYKSFSWTFAPGWITQQSFKKLAEQIHFLFIFIRRVFHFVRLA